MPGCGSGPFVAWPQRSLSGLCPDLKVGDFVLTADVKDDLNVRCLDYVQDLKVGDPVLPADVKHDLNARCLCSVQDLKVGDPASGCQGWNEEHAYGIDPAVWSACTAVSRPHTSKGEMWEQGWLLPSISRNVCYCMMRRKSYKLREGQHWNEQSIAVIWPLHTFTVNMECMPLVSFVLYLLVLLNLQVHPHDVVGCPPQC